MAVGAPKAIIATAHKRARLLFNLMRHGMAYLKREESAYAEQARERREKQWQRRAKELGYELKKGEPIVETITVDGEVLTVTTDGQIATQS